MGSLPKHSTPVKMDSGLRKRLNQTFFSGGPTFSLQKESPGTSQTPGRSKPRAKRRLVAGSGQRMISSIFSPRVRAEDSGASSKDDPNGMVSGVAVIGDGIQ